MSSCSQYNDASGYCSSALGNSKERVTRILLLGETSVGKTLLIRRLLESNAGVSEIERSDEGVSVLETLQCSRQAAEDDKPSGDWGPTVGIDVHALKRITAVPEENATNGVASIRPLCDATAVREHTRELPSLYSVEKGSCPNPYVDGTPCYASGSGGSSTVLLYRGQAGTSARASTFLPYSALPCRFQSRRTVSQIVELHELGGTHGFLDIAQLALSSTHYDGIMFVYHRRSLTSILYLKEWYIWAQKLFSSNPIVDAHNGADAKTYGRRSSRMPRFMLVGTQLPGDELSTTAAGLRTPKGSVPLSSGIISDETLLDDNLELKLRALYSSQTKAQHRGVHWVFSVALRALAWPYHVCWCLFHPFFFLSVQYEEERGPLDRRLRWGYRFLERLVFLLYRAEQTLLYLMAVILFGPHQEAVVLGHASSKATLGHILNDELCVAQAHVCRLDSYRYFQSSLDELLVFFDILLSGVSDEAR